MKNALTIAVLILLTSLSMSAQLSNGLTVSIPFGFVAANKTFPAGEYHVYEGPSAGVVTVRSSDGKAGAFVLTQRSESLEPPKQSSLVFNRYGRQYFLSRISVEGQRSGIVLPPSAAETKVARELAAVKEAVPASTVTKR